MQSPFRHPKEILVSYFNIYYSRKELTVHFRHLFTPAILIFISTNLNIQFFSTQKAQQKQTKKSN